VLGLKIVHKIQKFWAISLKIPSKTTRWEQIAKIKINLHKQTNWLEVHVKKAHEIFFLNLKNKTSFKIVRVIVQKFSQNTLRIPKKPQKIHLNFQRSRLV
jgi:hypothetical protein